MNIDLRTLFIVLVITDILQAVAIFLQYLLNKTYRGIGWWALGFSAVAIGFAFTLVREVISNDLISMIFANVIIFSGALFIYIGTVRFLDKKESRAFVISIFVVFILSHVYFDYVNNDITLRSSIVSAALAVVSFLTALSLFVNKTRTFTISANFVAAVFLVHSCFFIFRTVALLTFATIDTVLTPTLMQTSVFLVQLVAGILLTFGLIIMVNQRLNADMAEAKEHLELIFNTSHDASQITRLHDSMIVNVNDEFTDLSGFTRDETIGKTSTEINLWKYPADRQKMVDELEKKGHCENIEAVFQRKDGSQLIGLLSAKIVTLRGQPHIVSVIRDITERKQMYEKMTQIAKEWQSTFDSITDLVSIQDRNFKLIRVNKAYSDIFHKKPEELMGKLCYEVVHRTSCPIDNCPQEKALSTKTSAMSEIFEPGLGVYLEISCSPIFNEQGQFMGTIHIAKDSTERRQIKEELQNNRDRLNEMSRIAKVGGWEFDVQTRVQTWTDEVYAIHELAPDHQPTVTEGINYYAPEAIPVINDAVQRAIQFGESFDLELPFITARGNYRWVHSVGRAYQKDGKTTKVGGIIQDITEPKKVEKALQESEEKHKALSESSLTGVFITQDDKFIYVNNEFSRMHGYQPDELLDKEIWLTLPEQEREMIKKRISQRTAGEQVPHIITRKRLKKDGTEFWAEQVMNVFEYKGKPAYMGNILDVTERRQLQQKLEKMATYDYLTGLPNRALLADRFTIATALARRNKSRLAVMSLDLDKFKTINDTLGHEAGDQVLKVFSARLSGIIRVSDTIARIGGDEFILLMLETKRKEDATAIAQKILESLKEPLSIDDHELHLSTSIGIALYPEDAEDLETLIKKSDAAMYYSKGHGRNQFKFYGDGDVRMGSEQ